MEGLLRPFVYWGQKNDHISLNIDLRDVKVDNVDLSDEHLEFRVDAVGAQGRNKYGFDLDFYLPVDAEESKMRLTDRAVEFHIKKKGEGEVWPRLTEKQQRLSWLKIDFDKFAYDDDSEEEKNPYEGMSEQEASEQMMKNIEKQLLEESGPPLDVKTVYLFLYNMFQFMGFFYIMSTLSYNLVKHGAGAKERAFELVAYQIMTCQVVMCLEVVHPLLGLVKTGVSSPLIQVCGRNFILFVLLWQEIRLQDAPVIWYLFMSWGAIELVRYPYYMLTSIGRSSDVITWLRYSAWIPLYPLGILFEATIIIMSIPLFEESGRMSLSLPNSANMAFYFPWILHSYLLLLAIGGVVLMKHLYKQRKKRLAGVSLFSFTKQIRQKKKK